MSQLPMSQTSVKTLENIKKGASEKHTVLIRYRDKNNALSEREIEPYEIKNGKLYGYSVEKQGIRTFFLDNILAAAPTNESFEPRFPILIPTT